jgi:hypothetical protein
VAASLRPRPSAPPSGLSTQYRTPPKLTNWGPIRVSFETLALTGTDYCPIFQSQADSVLKANVHCVGAKKSIHLI